MKIKKGMTVIGVAVFLCVALATPAVAEGKGSPLVGKCNSLVAPVLIRAHDIYTNKVLRGEPLDAADEQTCMALSDGIGAVILQCTDVRDAGLLFFFHLSDEELRRFCCAASCCGIEPGGTCGNFPECPLNENTGICIPES